MSFEGLPIAHVTERLPDRYTVSLSPLSDILVWEDVINVVYGDGDVIASIGRGGDDTISKANDAAFNALYGDWRSMGGDAIGRTDTLYGGDGSVVAPVNSC